MLQDTLLFAAPGNLFATLVAALFGLIVGSFLNVVIYRIPKMMQRESDNYVAVESGLPPPHTGRYNLMLPHSHCGACGHKITAMENIPVISYLVLRGKCRACQAPISARYPLVELLTGVLSAVLIWHFGSGWAGLASLVFLWLLISMTFIDTDTQMLPDDLTFPLLWAGLLVNINGTFVPLQDAVIGAAAGYLALWSVYWAFKLATGKEGMGYGDFKLLAGLDDVADNHIIVVPGRRRGRHRPDRTCQARTRQADTLRPLPGRRRLDRHAVRHAVVALDANP